MNISDNNPREVEKDYQDGPESTSDRTDQYDQQAVAYSEASDGIGQKEYRQPNYSVDQEVLERSQDDESTEDYGQGEHD